MMALLASTRGHAYLKYKMCPYIWKMQITEMFLDFIVALYILCIYLYTF
jgi:hypothetical protein